MAEWHYSQGGDQRGPVSAERLRDLIASGQVTPRDSAWRQGMADWTPISSIPELTPAGIRGGEPPFPDLRDDYGRDYLEDYRSIRREPRGVSRVTVWSILLLAGGALWLINFFLPWWGSSSAIPSRDEIFGDGFRERSKRMEDATRPNTDWYERHISASKRAALADRARAIINEGRGGTLSVTLLGFNTGTGLFAFIVALVILAAVIPTLCVRILAAWRWTGAFLFALLSVVLLVFGMLWLFGAPEADVPPHLSQGKIIGPYVHLAGCLLVLAGGVLEGIFGLLALVRGPK